MDRIRMKRTSATPAGVFIADKVYEVGADISLKMATDFVRGHIADEVKGKMISRKVDELNELQKLNGNNEDNISVLKSDNQNGIDMPYSQEEVSYYLENDEPHRNGAWYVFPDDKKIQGKEEAQHYFDEMKKDILKSLGMVE